VDIMEKSTIIGDEPCPSCRERDEIKRKTTSLSSAMGISIAPDVGTKRSQQEPNTGTTRALNLEDIKTTALSIPSR